MQASNRELARGAVGALTGIPPCPYVHQGPFRAVIRIRDGARAAARMADRWTFKRHGATVFLDAPDIHALYDSLIRLCYLSPLAQKALPFSLSLFNLRGRLGRWWVRRLSKQAARH
jgi:D-amino peptidase